MRKSTAKLHSSAIVLSAVAMLALFAILSFALPQITFQPPTLSDNATTGANWVFINLTSSEDLNQSLLEWGNSTGFTNVTMSNSSMTNWYVNMTSLADRTYNYTIWMQNTTYNWNQSARKFVTVDTSPPYSLYACQDLTIAGGSYILVQNVSSSGTCFNILANNITLDGAGFTVNYSQTTAGYGVNITGRNNVTVKSLNIVQGSGSAWDGVYISGMTYSRIANNSIRTNNYYGINFASSSYNNISDNNVSTVQGTAYTLIIQGSSTSNTFSNNILFATSANAVYLYGTVSSNNIIGGSIRSGGTDYAIRGAGTANNFTSTNFTGSRKIYFYDNSAWFNYNNQSDGNIWLKTNVSAQNTLTRTLVTWSQSTMKWNDTNSSANITAGYILTGLLPSTGYRVYNTSSGMQDNSYALTTDTSGSLNFTIALNGNTQVDVRQTTSPGYSLNSTSSTSAGISVIHSLYWTADDGLSTYIFSFDNCTGTFVNETFAFSGTGNWSNVTKTTNSTVGCTIRWKVYANDTSNRWNESQIYSYVTTNNPPQYSNGGANNAVVGQPTQLSAYWQDDVGLSAFIFSTNNSGAWVNQTYTFTGTGNWSNVTITLNSTAGIFVGYRFYANDTANQWNDTGVLTINTVRCNAIGAATYNATTNTIVLNNQTSTLCTIYYDVNNQTAISYNSTTDVYTISANITGTVANLTISNVTMKFNSTQLDQYKIYIGGGWLIIDNSTVTIKDTTTNGTYFIEVGTAQANGAGLVITNSQLSYFGDPVTGNGAGIDFNSYAWLGARPQTTFNISNNVLSNYSEIRMDVAANLTGGNFDNNIINYAYTAIWAGKIARNNVLYNFMIAGLEVSSLIENNTVNSSWGGSTSTAIYCKESTNCTIRYNSVRNKYGSGITHYRSYISPLDEWSQYYNNTVTDSAICIEINSAYYGADVQNNTVYGCNYGIDIGSGNNSRIINNEIRNSTYGFRTQTLNMPLTLVRNNRITNNSYAFYLDGNQNNIRFINNNAAEYGTFLTGSQKYNSFYYFDVLVNTRNIPISNATVVITNLNDTNYPSIDINGINKTSFVTGGDGHTFLPDGNESNSAAVMAFWKNSTYQQNMTYSITAYDPNNIWTNVTHTVYPNGTIQQLQPLANVSGINPDSSWYRANPNTYQNTTTLQINYTKTSWRILPSNGSVNITTFSNYSATISSENSTNPTWLNATIPELANKKVSLLRNGTIWQNITADSSGFLSVNYTGGFSTYEFNWTESMGNVSGYIKDTSGSAIVNATTYLNYSNGTNAAFVNTSADGSYSYANVNANYNYTVTAVKSGYNSNTSSNFSIIVNGTMVVNLTLGGGTSLTACADLSIANTYYTLAQNVSSAGTCFNVLANNVTLDGQGYWVNYSTSQTGYGVNITGRNNVTVKNLNVVQGNSSVASAYAIYGYGMTNSTIINNTVNTKGSSAYGIYIRSSSNSNNISNNNIRTTGNTGFGIFIYISNTNSLSNNIIVTTANVDARGIDIESSDNNTINGGSIDTQGLSSNSHDYYLRNTGTTNNFINTNFTSQRTIYFWVDTYSAYFNYNNETNGNIWLKTNTSGSLLYLTRTLITWSNSTMKWNDTNSTANVTANYIITGLLPNANYKVYNTSAGTQSNPYALTTDASGDLNFTISLNGNTQIEVRQTTPPAYSLNSTTSTGAGTSVTHSLYWTADDGLSAYIFSFDNCTGSFVNETHAFSGTGNWSNVAKITNSTVGCTIRWKVYANDTGNRWNESQTYSYLTTNNPPYYSNAGVNTTIAGQPAEFSAYWQDDTGLSGFIFSTNNSGTWVNESWQPLTGIANWSRFTKTLNSTVGLPIGYRFYANDTANQWNDTWVLSLTTISAPAGCSAIGAATYNATTNTIILNNQTSTLCTIYYDVNNVSVLSYNASTNTYLLSATINSTKTTGVNLDISDSNLIFNSTYDNQYRAEIAWNLTIHNSTISANGKAFSIWGNVYSANNFYSKIDNSIIDGGSLHFGPTDTTVRTTNTPLSITDTTIKNINATGQGFVDSYGNPMDGIIVFSQYTATNAILKNITMSNVSVINPVASAYGSIISFYSSATNITLTNITISGVSASPRSVIWIFGTAQNATMTDITIRNVTGTAFEAKEGYVNVTKGTIRYTNMTIVNFNDVGFATYQNMYTSFDNSGIEVENIYIDGDAGKADAVYSMIFDHSYAEKVNLWIFNATFKNADFGFRVRNNDYYITNSYMSGIDNLYRKTFGSENGSVNWYELADVQLIGIDSNPIINASITITANITAPVPNVVDKWFYNKSNALTGADGHTPTPSDTTGTVAILRQRDYNSGYNTSYYSYTFTAYDPNNIWTNVTHTIYPNGTIQQLQPLANVSGVNPDSNWYRSNPNTYQNTTTLQINYTRTSWRILPSNGSVNITTFSNYSATISSENSTNPTWLNATIPQFANKKVSLLRNGTMWANVTADSSGFLSVNYTGGFSTYEFNWTESMGNVSGYIKDTSGSAIVNATTYLNYSNGTNAAFVNTSADGSYSYTSVNANYNYTVTAIKSGYTSNTSSNFSIVVNGTQVVNLTMGGGTSLTSCGDLSTANTYYTLTQNVSSAGTCFNVLANNITLDGAGFTVNYSQTVAGYGVNITSRNNVTVKNLNVVQGNSSGSSAIYLSGTTNSNLTTNNITTLGTARSIALYSSSNANNVSNNNITSSYYGLYLDSSSSTNTLSNNNITSGYIGISVNSANKIANNIIKSVNRAIWLYGVSSATVTNNDITTSGTSAESILLELSSSNTLTNNVITASGSSAYGISIGTANTNNITGGSVIAKNNYDYYLQSAGATNNFTNTNFTAQRRIWFNDNTSQFNYNNQTNGNIWLKTSLFNATGGGFSGAAINRTLVTWSNNTMKWNDTNSTRGIIAKYIITGLSSTTSYRVYNSSAGTQNNPYALTTDAAGALNFTIALNGNTEVFVWEVQPPAYSLNTSSSTGAGASVTHSLYWTSSDGLAGYIFSFDNGTGTFYNNSWVVFSGAGNWSNVTKTINSTVGATIQWMFYANDTGNRWNESQIYSYVTTNNSPQYSNVNVSTDVGGQPAEFSAYWQDDAGLSGFIFSTNNTGVWENESWQPMTGIGNWSRFTKTLNSTRNVSIGYRFYANDTSGQWNDTGVLSFITQLCHSLGAATYNSTTNTIVLYNQTSTLCTIYLDINNESVLSYNDITKTYLLNARINSSVTADKGVNLNIEDTTLLMNNSLDEEYYIRVAWNLTINNATIKSNNGKRFYVMSPTRLLGGYGSTGDGFTASITNSIIDGGWVYFEPGGLGLGYVDAISKHGEPFRIINTTIKNLNMAGVVPADASPLGFQYSPANDMYLYGVRIENVNGGGDTAQPYSAPLWFNGGGNNATLRNITIINSSSKIRAAIYWYGSPVNLTMESIYIENVTLGTGNAIGNKEGLIDVNRTHRYTNLTILNFNGIGIQTYHNDPSPPTYEGNHKSGAEIENLVLNGSPSTPNILLQQSEDKNDNYWIFNAILKKGNYLFKARNNNYSLTNTLVSNILIKTHQTTDSGCESGSVNWYELADIYVTDKSMTPVNNGTVIIIPNETVPTYENAAGGLGGGNVVSKWFYAKTNINTGSDGHTPLPVDEIGTVAILRQRDYNSGCNSSYYTYTLSAYDPNNIWTNVTHTIYPNGTIQQLQPLANVSGINPDSSWYRSNPNTYQNTTTLQINYTRTNITVNAGNNATNITVTKWNTSLSAGNIIINFTAQSVNGNNVNFTICNLTASTIFIINKNSTLFATKTSTAQGCISFNNSAWSTEEFTILADATPPVITIALPQNTTYASVNRTLNYTVTDNVAVSSCWYNYNGTNTTLAGCANATFTALNNNQSMLILYANDTSGNVNSANVTFTINAAAVYPQYSSVSVNATQKNASALFSAYWTDDGGLSAYIFSTNNSGAWQNQTYAITGTSNWSNVTVTLNDTVSTTVGYIFYANNTNGNWNNTGIQAIVISCMESWSYSDWSACSGSIQTRTASDSNSCGTIVNRSALSQSCSSGGTGSSGGGSTTQNVTQNRTNATASNATVIIPSTQNATNATSPSEPAMQAKAKEKIEELKQKISESDALAKQKLSEAERAYSSGDYEGAYALALWAEKLIGAASEPEGTITKYRALYPLSALALILLFILIHGAKEAERRHAKWAAKPRERGLEDIRKEIEEIRRKLEK